MGACSSRAISESGDAKTVLADHRCRKQEAKISRQIDAEAEKAFAQESCIIKLLLLGAGESGKSTLFRQMKRIYGVGFSAQEIQIFKQAILSNTILFMTTLLDAADELQSQIAVFLDPSRVQLKNEFLQLALDEPVYNAHMADLISELWSDQALKTAFDLRSQYQLPDCAGYFFDKAKSLCEPSYIPSNADILLSRIRTSGIAETRFKISGTAFDIFDVGGQRNERKKWIHCFENVTAVIFVIAVSEYDQVLFEDSNKNRMKEALELFEETVNSKWFAKVDIIVFLNKIDVLSQKIQKVSISQYFPDFKGGQDLNAASQYFTEQVLSRNHLPLRAVYCHCTTATDEANVIRVFSAVRDIVLRKNISKVGLL